MIMTGIAGAVFLTIGIACVHAWKHWGWFAAWCMLIAGLCLSKLGSGPITTATSKVIGSGDRALETIGAPGAAGLILVVVLGAHAFRAMWHYKKGPKAERSEAWAAFFFPFVVVALGGLTVVTTQLSSAVSVGVAQLGAFLGG